MADNTELVLIKMEVQGARESEAQIQKISNQLQRMKGGFATTTQEIKSAMTRATATKNKNMIPLRQQFDADFFGNIEDAKRESKQVFEDMKNRMVDVEKQAGKTQNAMLQFGLSTLFGGMAIKKFFEGIATDSFVTFNKLVANTMMANNATSQLTGAMTVLKYTMGEALNSVLETLVPLLMPLLEKIMEFVQTHSKLVGWVVIVGILLGGLMMLVGQFVLLGLGLKAGAVLFAGLGTAGATAGTAMAGGTAMGVAGLLKTGLMILAVIAIWKTLFSLLSGDESTTKWVKKVIVAIAGAVSYILYIITKVIQTIMSAIEVLGINVQWVFKSMGRIIQNVFADIINWVINAINTLLKGWNKIASSKAGKVLGLGQIGLMTGKMDKTSQSQVDFDRQEALRAEKERLAYYYSDEYAQKWKDGAIEVGEAFERGMTKISEGFGYKQFTGESTTADTTKADLIALANTQEQAANTNLSAATDFKGAVNDFKTLAKEAKTTNNKVYVDAFNNYNTTLPA